VVHESRGDRKESPGVEDEKMKIAWRYERLGQAGERGAWTFVLPAPANMQSSNLRASFFCSYTNGKYSASRSQRFNPIRNFSA
jgi:hypothetical protein